MIESFEWVEGLIGKPWVAGGRGPDKFDCWGLVTWVYNHVLNIELPQVPFIDPKDVSQVARQIAKASICGQWERLAKPEALCVIPMSTARAFHHVGLFLPIDGGTVLHAFDKANVIAQTFPSLRAKGINRFEFYRFKP